MTRRRLRRWLLAALAGALLFVQWASVAYACPLLAPSAAAELPAGMPCAEMMAGDPMDRAATAGLCIEHCKAGAQGLEPASPTLPPLPALPSSFAPQLAAIDAGPRWTPTGPRRDRGPPMPHSIVHCCHRL